MEAISVNIVDHALPTPVATKIELSVIEVVLNSYVSISVSYFNSNGNLIHNEHVKIEGEEYNNWGLDDQYLVNLVLTKLGLTKSG